MQRPPWYKKHNPYSQETLENVMLYLGVFSVQFIFCLLSYLAERYNKDVSVCDEYYASRNRSYYNFSRELQPSWSAKHLH